MTYDELDDFNNKTWTQRMSDDEWDDFLSLSRKDDECNDMWVKYKNPNDDTCYDDVLNFEERFWLKTCRDRKISSILGE
jgi:hypothetical protein